MKKTYNVGRFGKFGKILLGTVLSLGVVGGGGYLVYSALNKSGQVDPQIYSIYEKAVAEDD